MKYLSFAFVALLFQLLSACNKDKICLSPENCSVTSRYLPLAVGNYWIYETSSYNESTFIGSIFPYSDTIRVIGDTVIRGNIYYTIQRDDWLSVEVRKDTTYWRDSVGYIINEQGEIRFSAIDFDNVLFRDNFIGGVNYEAEFSVKDSLIFHITPAGYFNCLDFAGRYWLNGEEITQRSHNCYAENIGLIYASTFYFSIPNVIYQRSLKEYHLEE